MSAASNVGRSNTLAQSNINSPSATQGAPQVNALPHGASSNAPVIQCGNWVWTNETLSPQNPAHAIQNSYAIQFHETWKKFEALQVELVKHANLSRSNKDKLFGEKFKSIQNEFASMLIEGKQQGKTTSFNIKISDPNFTGYIQANLLDVMNLQMLHTKIDPGLRSAFYLYTHSWNSIFLNRTDIVQNKDVKLYNLKAHATAYQSFIMSIYVKEIKNIPSLSSEIIDDIRRFTPVADAFCKSNQFSQTLQKVKSALEERIAQINTLLENPIVKTTLKPLSWPALDYTLATAITSATPSAPYAPSQALFTNVADFVHDRTAPSFNTTSVSHQEVQDTSSAVTMLRDLSAKRAAEDDINPNPKKK